MTTPFKPFRFLDWRVYQDARELFFETRKIATALPRDYRFEIGSQVIRSSLSIVLNIAEGSGKFSPRDVGRFLDISIGSLYETRAVFDILENDPGLSVQIPAEIIPTMDQIGKQLGGLRKSILKNSSN